MKVWTVIRCGDGESYSAWVTQELAWKNALSLAEKINVRIVLQGLYQNTRTRVSREGEEIVVETLRRLDWCGKVTWTVHATIRVSSAVCHSSRRRCQRACEGERRVNSIKVGDQVTWTDREGKRCTGRVSEVEAEKFSSVTYLVIIDGEDERRRRFCRCAFIHGEVQLESAVDRLGNIADVDDG